jgi:hypothetical protein
MVGAEGNAVSTLNPNLRGVVRRKRSGACIVHKSLEICEQCRLWHLNSPASPDCSDALFERMNLKRTVFILFEKPALELARKRLFNGLLARNELVASAFAWFLRASLQKR